MSRIVGSLALACLCSRSNAFSISRGWSRLELKAGEELSLKVGQVAGIFGVAAAVLTFNAADVCAYSDNNNCISQQSAVLMGPSIQVAEKITTMDFSLPSSYDKIADVKTNAKEELTVEENLITGTKRKAAPKASSDSISFGKQLTEEEKAAISAEREAKKEALAAEKAAIAAEKAAEKEAQAAEAAAQQKARAEQQAADKEQKAVEKAQKAAADKAAAEARESKKASSKYSAADIVDMGLPSYSDAASTSGKKASPFAI